MRSQMDPTATAPSPGPVGSSPTTTQVKQKSWNFFWVLVHNDSSIKSLSYLSMSAPPLSTHDCKGCVYTLCPWNCIRSYFLNLEKSLKSYKRSGQNKMEMTGSGWHEWFFSANSNSPNSADDVLWQNLENILKNYNLIHNCLEKVDVLILALFDIKWIKTKLIPWKLYAHTWNKDSIQCLNECTASKK